jgi:26S proteasome non-ATPase regulatory subunit 9
MRLALAQDEVRVPRSAGQPKTSRLTERAFDFRTRFAALRNDYERITDEIQKRVIEQMSGEGRVERVTTKLAATTTKQSTEEAKTDARGDVLDEDAGRAFAVIDEVIEGSPGYTDGLQVGDRVCAVGEVRWAFSDPSAEPPAELIPNAARTFGVNENSAVRVVVLRRGDHVTLSVTPRAWSGRGLVGCHMRSV